jgi:hypothetical protein
MCGSDREDVGGSRSNNLRPDSSACPGAPSPPIPGVICHKDLYVSCCFTQIVLCMAASGGPAAAQTVPPPGIRDTRRR